MLDQKFMIAYAKMEKLEQFFVHIVIIMKIAQNVALLKADLRQRLLRLHLQPLLLAQLENLQPQQIQRLLILKLDALGTDVEHMEVLRPLVEEIVIQ